MKKNFYYAMISAALLTGAAGFSACSSDDVVTEVNPNLSEDGKAVKTQFALNIPRAKSGRMTDEYTQGTSASNFLGMKNIRLIPLITEEYEEGKEPTMLITLGDISADESTNKNIKKYDDVMIQVGTKGFLFYGNAEEGNDASSKFDKGILSDNVAQGIAPSTYEFKLEKICPIINDVVKDKQAEYILSVLNELVGKETGWTESKDPKMMMLLASFGELKAGSANSVKAAVEGLYNNVVNYEPETVGGKIKKVISEYFTVGGSKDAWTLTWKNEGVDFPTNLNLPEGAVAVEYDGHGSKKFSYSVKNVIGNSNVEIKSITFPASLYYTVNTPVRTNSSPTIDFPTSLSEWTGVDAFKDWGSVVNSTTRKIALKKTINYGVAQFETKFKCSKKTLPAATHKGVEQNVTVPQGGFTITGLLIGGQPNSVGYNFQPKANGTHDFDMTVYDNHIASKVAAAFGEDLSANYTLLLSNQKLNAQGSSEETQNEVDFAVELKNTSGEAFRGVQGIVPVNGTFYLVGRLSPANKKVENVVNPSVFMPDYKTTATLTINTLANAYNTIPDLRATNLQLGLAVDLSWTKGIEFGDVVIGGE